MNLARITVVSLIVCALVIGAVAPGGTLFAATVRLKSGKNIEGRILEKTDQFVKIEVQGCLLYYELKYVEGIEDEPESSDPEVFFAKGLAYGSQAKFDEAKEQFQKGLKISPDDRNLGEALRIINDLNAGKINENYTVSLFRGSSFVINAKYKEAIGEFKKALNEKTDDADLYCYLGICSYSLEQYQEAIDYLKKGLAIKPDGELYYYLGASYYSLGSFPEAIESLNKSRELFEKDGDYIKSREIEGLLSELQ